MSTIESRAALNVVGITALVITVAISFFGLLTLSTAVPSIRIGRILIAEKWLTSGQTIGCQGVRYIIGRTSVCDSALLQEQ